MKIAFLIHGLYGLGGTNRTTVSTAKALADRGHEVDIVTIFRHRNVPLFSIDPRVRIVRIIDNRNAEQNGKSKEPAKPLTRREKMLQSLPSKYFPSGENRNHEYNQLIDVRLAEYLNTCDRDIVVGTRPGLNTLLCALTPKHIAVVGQEHMFHGYHGEKLQKQLYKAYERLDYLVTVSEADAKEWREHIPRKDLPIDFVPNSVPRPWVAPVDSAEKTIIAAGRVVAMKRYDIVINAFAEVVKRHPEWKLRIYGHGAERGKLLTQVGELGLQNHVNLMGTVSPIESEWAKGSIAAVASEFESFGLTLVEAMRCGLPVVSTACPMGPPEIVRDGEDGLLVPVNDQEAYTAALLKLVEDDELRRKMSLAAVQNAERYDPEQVTIRHEEIFEEVLAKPRPAAVPAPRPGLFKRLFGGGPGWAVTSVPQAFSHEVNVIAEPGGHKLWLELEEAVGAPLEWRLRKSDYKLTGKGVKHSSKEGLAEATFDWTTDPLDEGVYDLYVHRADTPKARRALSGVLDLRAMTHFQPDTDKGIVSIVPYQTVDKYLALRVWNRPEHAEAGDITFGDGKIKVAGQLYGFRPKNGEVQVLARLRNDKTKELTFPVELDEATGAFGFTIPCEEPTPHRVTDHDVWDLWLTRDGGTPLRIARYLDDVHARKTGWVYPVTVVEGTVRGDVRVRPYYTVDNELSFNVVDLKKK